MVSLSGSDVSVAASEGIGVSAGGDVEVGVGSDIAVSSGGKLVGRVSESVELGVWERISWRRVGDRRDVGS